MNWRIDPKIEIRAPVGLAFARRFITQFDTAQVDWFKIDIGSCNGSGAGVWGRCKYPHKHKGLGFRLCCHVNMAGLDEYRVPVRRRPVYVEYLQALDDEQSARLTARALLPAGHELGLLCLNPKTERAWFRVRGKTTVLDWDEGVVWIVGHECWHWLRRTRQVPGRNGEIEADEFGDWLLEQFRQGSSPESAADSAKRGAWVKAQSGHTLATKSLHDLVASCPCGGWSFTRSTSPADPAEGLRASATAEHARHAQRFGPPTVQAGKPKTAPAVREPGTERNDANRKDRHAVDGSQQGMDDPTSRSAV